MTGRVADVVDDEPTGQLRRPWFVAAAQYLRPGGHAVPGHLWLARLDAAAMFAGVARIASATPRASTDFPEPGSPANTTKSATPVRYRDCAAAG